MAVPYRCIADLVKRPIPEDSFFNRAFRIRCFEPACTVPPRLAAKYGLAPDNVQQVVSITDATTLDVCWWNPVRSSKPQNFTAAAAAAPADPTGGGGAERCDFCAWPELTAADPVGRIEGPHAVSCSNLFKYIGPYHGVILWKHLHDPLSFDADQLADMLAVAGGWFDAAAAHAVGAGEAVSQLRPLLVWNCGARAGASFHHGHCQTMVASAVDFPTLARAERQRLAYEAQGQGDSDEGGQGLGPRDVYGDVLRAHREVGLSRELAAGYGASAAAYCSVCPTKDAEVVVHGEALTCPAFQRLVYAALRALIDELGVQSFNATVSNIRLGGGAPAGRARGGLPVVARLVSRGRPAAVSSDFGGLEVFGGATIGHTDPWVVAAALDRALATLAAGGS